MNSNILFKSIKIVFTCAILLVFPNLLSAQTTIWKISSKTNTIYLGGTIHMLREQDFPLPIEYDSIFNLSDKVAFEADIEMMQKPEFVQKIMSTGVYPSPKTIKDVLKPNVFKLLNSYCDKLSIPILNIQSFKPSLIIISLMQIKLMQMGLNSIGIDQYYYSKCISVNKGKLFLETPDEQLSMITDMGKGYENEFIVHSLKDMDNEFNELPDMIEAIKNGSSKRFVNELDSMKKDYPALYQDIVSSRNKKWIPILDNYLTTPETEFVLFGALHLYGKDGVLELLKQKGYSIQQL